MSVQDEIKKYGINAATLATLFSIPADLNNQGAFNEEKTEFVADVPTTEDKKEDKSISFDEALDLVAQKGKEEKKDKEPKDDKANPVKRIIQKADSLAKSIDGIDFKRYNPDDPGLATLGMKPSVNSPNYPELATPGMKPSVNSPNHTEGNPVNDDIIKMDEAIYNSAALDLWNLAEKNKLNYKEASEAADYIRKHPGGMYHKPSVEDARIRGEIFGKGRYLTEEESKNVKDNAWVIAQKSVDFQVTGKVLDAIKREPINEDEKKELILKEFAKYGQRVDSTNLDQRNKELWKDNLIERYPELQSIKDNKNNNITPSKTEAKNENSNSNQERIENLRKKINSNKPDPNKNEEPKIAPKDNLPKKPQQIDFSKFNKSRSR